jgi:hypothetical protein
MIITYYRVEFLKETNILLSEIDNVIVFYGKREVQNCFRVLKLFEMEFVHHKRRNKNAATEAWISMK